MCVLFDMAVERHADLPWAREHLGILDGGFVMQNIRPARRIPFYNVQGVTVKIARAVEPRLIVEAGDVDDEGVALPMSHRPAHPTVRGTFARIAHAHGAHGPGIGMGEENGGWALH